MRDMLDGVYYSLVLFIALIGFVYLDLALVLGFILMLLYIPFALSFRYIEFKCGENN
jgi:hypothetical protein